MFLVIGIVALFAANPSSAQAAEKPLIEACAKPFDPLQVLRFETPIEALKPLLSGSIEDMLKADARGKLFWVEALLRVYRNIEGEPYLSFYVKVKKFEDLLGALSETQEFIQFAREVGADARAIAFMQAEEKIRHTEVEQGLPEIISALKELMDSVRATEWTREKKDTKRIVNEISRQMKALEPLDYDLSKLQKGIHEMRRQLRWILIYVQAFDGILLPRQSQEPLKRTEYASLVDHPIAHGRFSRVDANPRVEHPRYLPTAYFLALSLAVEQLGKIKSYAEDVEALARALEESGVAGSSKRAHALAEELGRRHPTWVDQIERRARYLRNGLLRSGLIRQIRKELEDTQPPKGILEPAEPTGPTPG